MAALVIAMMLQVMSQLDKRETGVINLRAQVPIAPRLTPEYKSRADTSEPASPTSSSHPTTDTGASVDVLFDTELGTPPDTEEHQASALHLEIHTETKGETLNTDNDNDNIATSKSEVTLPVCDAKP